MKKLVLLSLASLSPLAVTAQLIVSWERWDDPATATSRGAFQSIDPDLDGTATWSGTSGSEWASGGFGGSYDGDFGALLSGADTAQAGTQAIRTLTTASPVYVDFLVENNTVSESYDLGTFHFDAWRSFGGSPGTYDLEVLAGGGITAGLIVSSGAFAIQGSQPGNSGNDYEDFDIDLTGLADRTLSPGEVATFRLSIAAGNANLYLDNVAVSSIPEPGSFGLLIGMGMAACVVCLRRRRWAR